ncbi:chitinase 1 [Fusarium albosuccineum]|uniref:chitinase n=1 Tax=Fusarium albosuccineum TaxID=1237068 RepID=A0A8H4LFD3_9HYPO|nr:chitinase 1 [Fusarium albosuccineum]
MLLFCLKLTYLLIGIQIELACSTELGTLQQYQLDPSEHDTECVEVVPFVNLGVYPSQNGHRGRLISHFANAVYVLVKVDMGGTVYGFIPVCNEKQIPDSLSSSHAEGIDMNQEISGDGNSWLEDHVTTYRCIGQPYLRQVYQNSKLILSIGGWIWSTEFATIASKASTRAIFARSAVALLKNWEFDGIDIDWEPAINENDVANMVLLLEAVRAELNSVPSDNHLDLSVVAPIGLENSDMVPEIARNLDHIDLMISDYAEPWSFDVRHESHHDPIFDEFSSTQSAVEDAVHSYLEAGMPAEKITLGLPIPWRLRPKTTGLDELSTDPTLVKTVKWEIPTLEYCTLAEIEDTPAFNHASHHISGAILHELPIHSPAEATRQQSVFSEGAALGQSLILWGSRQAGPIGHDDSSTV